MVSNALYPDRIALLYKDMLIGFVFLFFMFQEDSGHMLHRIREQIGHATFALALFFLFICLGQIFNPHSPGLVLGMLGFKNYFLGWLLLPMAYAYIDNPESVRKFFAIQVLFSIPVNIFGIYQFFAGPEFLVRHFGGAYEGAMFHAAVEGQTTYTRILGTFASTGQYSNFLQANAMFCFALILTAKTSKDRILWTFCQVLNLLAIMGAGSRGAVVILGICLITLGLIAKGKRPFIASALIAGIIFYFGFNWLGHGVADRFKTLKNINMVKERTYETTGGIFIQQLNEYPMGKGLGSASTGARHLQMTMPSKKRQSWVLVENFPAKLQVETGIVGVCVFFLFLFLLLSRWRNYWMPYLQFEENQIGLPLSAYVLTNLAVLSFFGILDTPPGYLYLWTVMGMIIKLVDLSEAETSSQYPAMAA